MGRLVKATQTFEHVIARGNELEGLPESTDTTNKVTVQKDGDTYLERVAKYIPSEIIAFFIFTNNILKQSITGAGTEAAVMAGYPVTRIAIIVFFGAWIVTPIYLYRMKEAGDAWILNALLATLLFPIWAYAVNGVGPSHYVPFDGYLASIVLGAATLASGLVRPAARTTTTVAGQTATVVARDGSEKH